MTARATRRDAIRRDNAARKAQPSDQRPPRAPRPHAEDDDHSVVGFGADMPAFMLVSGKI